MDRTPELEREPCPDRILDDIGGAFSMGAIGGTAYHFVKGLKNSPHGARFIGAREAVMMNAPRLAGSFAAWGGLFSVMDCTMVYARQKEDPYNSIIAGFATGGLLSLRQGLRPAMRSAVMGGVMLAFIQGVGILNAKLTSPNPQLIDEAPPQNYPEVSPTPSPSPSPSWFRGLFGGKEEEVKTNVKTEVLESFDSPAPPTFEFT